MRWIIDRLIALMFCKCRELTISDIFVDDVVEDMYTLDNVEIRKVWIEVTEKGKDSHLMTFSYDLQIAQLAERSCKAAGVDGSSPSLPTKRNA